MWFRKPQAQEPRLLTPDDVILKARAADKWEAIRMVGERLLAAGHITPDYLAAMARREEEFTTYVGNGLAIPHGTGESKQFILTSGLSIAQFPEGIDFGNGNVAYLVIGIAGVGNEHLDLLSRIALQCENPAVVQRLARAGSVDEILQTFA